jgi:hypothetical protein
VLEIVQQRYRRRIGVGGKKNRRAAHAQVD